MPRFIGHIELGQILGRGGFGKVYLGRDTKAKADVAVKLIDKEVIKANKMDEYVQREIAIMRRLQHPHVIKLKSVVEMPHAFCLVMELASNGELFDKILDAKRFDEEMARKYFQQLISAVAYCHSKGVVHRDLKAENLLLGEGGQLKVCDFGLSRYTLRNGKPDQNIKFMSLAGSPDYQAPEMSTPDAGGYAGEGCDVWSCGVILFFMLTGRLPFSGRDDEETSQRIMEGKYDREHRHLSPAAADLISRILTVKPHDRIKIIDIVNHPWFDQGFDKTKLPDSLNGGNASPLNLNSAPNGFKQIEVESAHCCDSLVATLHRAFKACNVDKTGRMKREEVRDVLINLNDGTPVENEEVQAVMECFHLEEDGSITEDEFVQGWAAADKRLGGRLPLARLVNIFHYDMEKDLVEALRRAFDRLDTNHNGCVTKANVLDIPELKLTEAEASTLIDAMDSRKCGNVTFQDFVRAITSTDVLSCHEIGARLKRIREMFDAVDRGSLMSYVNTGFTVAGFRDQIVTRLMKTGHESSTKFTEGSDDTYLQGEFTDAKGRRIEVGVQLLPAATGYTKVLSYRVCGKTEVFHEWFGTLRQLLWDEIVQCAEDTSIKGDSELV